MKSLIPRQDFRTMTDSLFGEFWNEIDKTLMPDPFGGGLKGTSKFAYPKMNIQDTDLEVVIEAGVPGLTKKDVTINLDDELLTITGAKQNSNQDDRNGYIVRELHKSKFSRSVILRKEQLNLSQIKASVAEGILTIKIPKRDLDKSSDVTIIEVE